MLAAKEQSVLYLCKASHLKAVHEQLVLHLLQVLAPKLNDPLLVGRHDAQTIRREHTQKAHLVRLSILRMKPLNTFSWHPCN
jgi:hypothetical protein